MKLYRINEIDDKGSVIRSYGVFSAADKRHAKIAASKRYRNPEMRTTGFYGAEEVNMDQLSSEGRMIRRKCERELTSRTKIMNY